MAPVDFLNQQIRHFPASKFRRSELPTLDQLNVAAFHALSTLINEARCMRWAGNQTSGRLTVQFGNCAGFDLNLADLGITDLQRSRLFRKEERGHLA